MQNDNIAFRWSKAEEPVKTCWNCNKVVFEKCGEGPTNCSEGHWSWDNKDVLYLITDRNRNGCDDWELLERLRGKRGAITEW